MTDDENTAEHLISNMDYAGGKRCGDYAGGN